MDLSVNQLVMGFVLYISGMLWYGPSNDPHAVLAYRLSNLSAVNQLQIIACARRSRGVGEVAAIHGEDARAEAVGLGTESIVRWRGRLDDDGGSYGGMGSCRRRARSSQSKTNRRHTRRGS